MSPQRGCPRAGTAAPADERADRKLKIVGAVLGALLLALIGWFGYDYIAGQKISAEMIKFEVVSDTRGQGASGGPQGRGRERLLHAALAGRGRRRGRPRGLPLRPATPTRIDKVVTLRTTPRHARPSCSAARGLRPPRDAARRPTTSPDVGR